jgi:hypothetical protein
MIIAAAVITRALVTSPETTELERGRQMRWR